MKLVRYIVAAAALFSFAPASAATLIGETMEVFHDSPSIFPRKYGTPSPFTVGAGVDSVVAVGDHTDLLVDVRASSLLITFNTSLTNPAWGGGGFPRSFDGLSLWGAGFTPIPMTRASLISTSLAGFDKDRVFHWSGGGIGLDFRGLTYNDGTKIRVYLNQTQNAIPEPATWMMLLAGFGAIGGAMRSAKRGQRLTRT